MNTLVVGLQYGDEGKGRVSAMFADSSDWYVRFNGGPNAGHTVYHEGKKHSLHHLPSGAVLGKKVALDAGMVIDMTSLLKECETAGVSISDLHISKRAHIISDVHKGKDQHGSQLGTTKKGIAYVYADKMLRKGLRASYYKSLKLYDGLPPIAPSESALYESAQGIMLDIDYGHYPYVTSSNVLPNRAHKIDWTVGVMKAYTSRVGDGPPNLPQLEWLTAKGDEYGTTTGRPRKCYWAIMDELRYAMEIARPDEIVVTKLDILEGCEIKVWDNGKEKTIGDLDSYKTFLVEQFPKIKYFSESPDGDLIEV